MQLGDILQVTHNDGSSSEDLERYDDHSNFSNEDENSGLPQHIRYRGGRFPRGNPVSDTCTRASPERNDSLVAMIQHQQSLVQQLIDGQKVLEERQQKFEETLASFQSQR